MNNLMSTGCIRMIYEGFSLKTDGVKSYMGSV